MLIIGFLIYYDIMLLGMMPTLALWVGGATRVSFLSGRVVLVFPVMMTSASSKTTRMAEGRNGAGEGRAAFSLQVFFFLTAYIKTHMTHAQSHFTHSFYFFSTY